MLQPIEYIVYICSFVLTLILFSISIPIDMVYFLGGFWGVSLRLSQMFAGVSMLYVYGTLFISPIYHVFPNLYGKKGAITARKSLGICSSIFILLHVFFGYRFIGGFDALRFFGPAYNLSIIVGLFATSIICVLSITSHTWLHMKLGKYWKHIHRWVYLAGIATLIHTFLITTHLEPYEFLYSLVGFILLSILLTLESVRLNDFIQTKNKFFSKNSISWFGSLFCIVVLYWAFFILYHPH